MKHTVRALALILALLPAFAAAQTPPILPANSVWGRNRRRLGSGAGHPVRATVAIHVRHHREQYGARQRFRRIGGYLRPDRATTNGHALPHLHDLVATLRAALRP